MANLTTPRQVRVLKCALMSPGLEQRASNADDRNTLQNYGFDIMQFVQKIDIYESIFDNTIAGSITLLENVGLIEYLPIVGVETLVIVFAIDDNEGHAKMFKRAFRITKPSNILYPRHDVRLYTLHFVTNEFLLNIGHPICQAFTVMSCQNAVNTILQQSFGTNPAQIITNEATFGTVTAVIPNYTPLQAINFFATLAQTVDRKESNFLFFETLDGFHFTSVSQLIKTGLANTDMKVFQVNPGDMTNAETVDVNTAGNSILRVHQDQTFDLLQDVASGMLRSKVVHFDFLAKQLDATTDSRYSDTFANTTHLDKHPVYPKNYDLTYSRDVRLFTVASNYWTEQSSYIKSKQDEIKDSRLHDAIVLRNRQLRELRHMQTLIDLPGQTDLRAGSVVKVLYPSTRILQGSNPTINTPLYQEGTPYHSGPHLVVSVHHILAKTTTNAMEYRMNIRVCRDSLAAPLIGTTNEDGK